MKRDHPDLFAALLVGVLANVLLRSQTAYLPRAGLFALPVSVPVLAGTGWAFARAWRPAGCRALRLLFAVLLVYSSVLEILRLSALTSRLYPGSIGLSALCLLLLLPVLYLRRVSALSQTAYVVLCLLAVSGVGMVLSLAPRLYIPNLSAQPLTTAELAAAAADQLTLYPEYLLPALWPEHEKRGRHTLSRLAGLALGLDAAAHTLLALFYGAALPDRIDPLHTAASSGVLSVFHRLEWLQLVLWLMAVTVKLALYLYAVTRLLGGHTRRNATALQSFPLYIGGLWFLCLVLRTLDPEAALARRSLLCWLFAGTVCVGGACLWIYKKITGRC